MMTLDEIRPQIDAIDTQMKPLFLKRMECAGYVAQAKSKTGSDVFVPERERAIIEKRASDVQDVRDEYVAFLRHLMSVSRRYQYGKLTDMQDRVLEDALNKANLNPAEEHDQIQITFSCSKAAGNLNLYLNMIQLNGVPLDRMELVSEADVQNVRMVLDGSLNEHSMRCLLCQIAKESEGFTILALKNSRA